MNDTYEKLGLFYLGKHYDSDAQKIEDDLLLYKSKHLVTHGVCTYTAKNTYCLRRLFFDLPRKPRSRPAQDHRRGR